MSKPNPNQMTPEEEKSLADESQWPTMEEVAAGSLSVQLEQAKERQKSAPSAPTSRTPPIPASYIRRFSST